MKSVIQFFLAVQFAPFAFAAAAHAGALANRSDPGAAIAEAVIAGVLLAGLGLTFTRSADVRSVALGAQGFALLGTLIGTTLVLTVGPTEAFDVTMHSVMLATLLAGLATTFRAPRSVRSVGLPWPWLPGGDGMLPARFDRIQEGPRPWK